MQFVNNPPVANSQPVALASLKVGDVVVPDVGIGRNFPDLFRNPLLPAHRKPRKRFREGFCGYDRVHQSIVTAGNIQGQAGNVTHSNNITPDNTHLREIHTPIVTSDLAFHSKSGHHGQSGTNRLEWRGRPRNSFAVKILVSKPFALKILTHRFCKTRAGQGFQRYRGWGDILGDNTFESKIELPGSTRIASRGKLFQAEIHRTFHLDH